jgi:hypothetical protein
MKRILLGAAAVAVALAITTPAYANEETCVTYGPRNPWYPNEACVPVQVCVPCVISPAG